MQTYGKRYTYVITNVKTNMINESIPKALYIHSNHLLTREQIFEELDERFDGVNGYICEGVWDNIKNTFQKAVDFGASAVKKVQSTIGNTKDTVSVGMLLLFRKMVSKQLKKIPFLEDFVPIIDEMVTKFVKESNSSSSELLTDGVEKTIRQLLSSGEYKNKLDEDNLDKTVKILTEIVVCLVKVSLRIQSAGVTTAVDVVRTVVNAFSEKQSEKEERKLSKEEEQAAKQAVSSVMSKTLQGDLKNLSDYSVEKFNQEIEKSIGWKLAGKIGKIIARAGFSKLKSKVSIVTDSVQDVVVMINNILKECGVDKKVEDVTNPISNGVSGGVKSVVKGFTNSLKNNGSKIALAY